ncbi:SMC-Scp complex subunit ScpB [Rhizobium rhizoryzae]|uniref:Chromosome segregation and condensation protein ScpB n=1 Tax=Rhizobium rhizoryzae TaxID=451876 RepID=A0A7W6LKC7_9HYPH|nr:chromosome segregation and condensation protein ScpB [Rhizobium rhizoryzae]
MTLSEYEAMVLTAVGYFQPVTCGDLSKIFAKDVSCDTIGNLRGSGFIGSGPSSSKSRVHSTYVRTSHFLSSFGFEALRDLPIIEALEDAGFLSSRTVCLAPSITPGDLDSDEHE